MENLKGAVNSQISELRDKLDNIENRLKDKKEDSFCFVYWNRKLERAIQELDTGKVTLD